MAASGAPAAGSPASNSSEAMTSSEKPCRRLAAAGQQPQRRQREPLASELQRAPVLAVLGVVEEVAAAVDHVAVDRDPDALRRPKPMS